MLVLCTFLLFPLSWFSSGNAPIKDIFFCVLPWELCGHLHQTGAKIRMGMRGVCGTETLFKSLFKCVCVCWWESCVWKWEGQDWESKGVWREEKKSTACVSGVYEQTLKPDWHTVKNYHPTKCYSSLLKQNLQNVGKKYNMWLMRGDITWLSDVFNCWAKTLVKQKC